MYKFQNRRGKLSVDFVDKIVNRVFVSRGIILYTKVPGENYTGSVFKKQSKITSVTDSGFMYQSIAGIPEDKSTYIIMAVIRNEFHTGAVLKIPYTARIAVF